MSDEPTNEKEIYCVYAHRIDNGKPFYIGMGKPYRPFEFKKRSELWKRTVAKHCSGEIPFVQIIAENLTWDMAAQVEQAWIFLYGRKNKKTWSPCKLNRWR